MSTGITVQRRKKKPSTYPFTTITLKLTREQDAAFMAYLDALGYGSKKTPFLKALLFKAMDEFYKGKEARA